MSIDGNIPTEYVACHAIPLRVNPILQCNGEVEVFFYSSGIQNTDTKVSPYGLYSFVFMMKLGGFRHSIRAVNY